VARVRVVLVRPSASANVGACARVVRNAGLAGLDLVDPGDFRTVECWRTAWGAHEVLEEARVFDELRGALAGVALAFAFTGRRRAEGPPVDDVRDAAAAVRGLAPDAAAALVFGPETSGLTNAELSLCGRAATIPADPAQPSYNLSHAVAIAAYEVRRAGPPLAPRPRPLATHDQKERLLVSLEAGLHAIQALPRTHAGSAFAEWRALVQRLDLSPSELELVEHLARKLSRQSH
jgi:TrmH family RNA methyltransferase